MYIHTTKASGVTEGPAGHALQGGGGGLFWAPGGPSRCFSNTIGGPPRGAPVNLRYATDQGVGLRMHNIKLPERLKNDHNSKISLCG